MCIPIAIKTSFYVDEPLIRCRRRLTTTEGRRVDGRDVHRSKRVYALVAIPVKI